MLPPEILDAVFACLDDAALQACALVSSPFLFLARGYLFAHVFLLPSSAGACTKLLHLLSCSPALARHIRRVSIIDGRLFPSLSPGPMPRDKLNGPRWFLSTPPSVLHALFQKLQLRAFDLIFQDGPNVAWNLIPHASALHLLFTSPSLHSLHLRGISWDTPTSLSTTLSQSSVTNLTLHNVKLLSTTRTTSWTNATQTLCAKPFSPPTPTTHPSTPALPPPLPLESLQITSTFDPVTLPQDPDTLGVLRSLTPLIPFPLKRLLIPGITEIDSLPELIAILVRSGVANGLEELELGDRLSFVESSCTSIPIIDFSPFTNLRILHFGIQIPNNAASLHDTTCYHPPSTLIWLSCILETISNNLSRLKVTFKSDLIMTDSEMELDWRRVVDVLRGVRGRGVGVDLSFWYVRRRGRGRSGGEELKLWIADMFRGFNTHVLDMDLGING